MKKIHYFYFTFALVISGMAFSNTVHNILVYTTSAYKITHQELATNIYYLDAVEKIEDEISQGFSQNPIVAERQAKALRNSLQWSEKEVSLKKAYMGVISGWQNGIKKVPAILFQLPELPEKQVVIYGETNVAQAKQQLMQWLHNREGKK